MKITSVVVTPIESKNSLVAFASCVIDKSLKLNSIGIHRRLDNLGFRLTFPTKKAGARNDYLFHPITPEASKEIEKTIIKEYLDSTS